MAGVRRGLPSVRTVSALLDDRRARTAGGAYLELSAIANERSLLNRELERWKRRRGEIEERLAAIAKKEARLLAVTHREIPKHHDLAAAENTQPPEPKVRYQSKNISY